MPLSLRSAALVATIGRASAEKMKISRHGHTYFVSHFQSQHLDDYTALVTDLRRVVDTVPVLRKTSSLFFIKKTVHLHGWIGLIILGFQPFSILGNASFQECVRFESCEKNTPMKNRSLLTSRFEGKIKLYSHLQDI